MARFIDFQHKRYRVALNEFEVKLSSVCWPKKPNSIITHDRVSFWLEIGDKQAQLFLNEDEIEALILELSKLKRNVRK